MSETKNMNNNYSAWKSVAQFLLKLILIIE